ncbi:MAG TPA: hypothetical protein PKK10_01350, partial [Woeseiaceae bacterium]|nr:hypothetical protein [Woeseiaceae bacterium]
ASGRQEPTATLASLAGRASGSAARSLYGGFAELENAADDVSVRTLIEPQDWPLSVVIAITATGAKAVGSSEAMERSRTTSPFYGLWVDEQPGDLAAARAAILARDFGALGKIAEHNCLKMHSVMWTARPPIIFWNPATLKCLETVRTLQNEGVEVFFTIDAGPQVKAVCTPQAASRVQLALQETDGVQQVLSAGLGHGAALVGAAC